MVRKLQGSLVDTKRVMATLRKAGAAIRDSIDPYLQTTLFAGRASTRVADFAEKKLRRLLTEMAMHKISQQPLADYPWARHAEERNAEMARRNPFYQTYANLYKPG